MKKMILSAVIVLLLIANITGCTAPVTEEDLYETQLMKMQELSPDARITAPDGFIEAEPATENTLFEYYKDSAVINLSSVYVGTETLDEYVKDSKEKLEDDAYSFMEFAFISPDGLLVSGEGKKAVAFKALHNKVFKKFWMVFILQDDYVFEITCSASEEEFNALADTFNKTINSFETF